MLHYYLANPKRTGALCSSSNHLAEVITKNIGIEQALNIIEIGPGMGVFTKVILRKNPNAQFFTIEINPKIANKLQTRFPNLDVVLGSVEFLQTIMQDKGMPYADVIVSGIPWALLSQADQKAFLQNIHNALKPGGYFATFAYLLPTIGARRFRKRIYKDKLFSEIKKSKIVWDNIPPAFVYYCKK
ncbi:methyltransferase domain-containing protein [Helicobacter sp. MIT 11-5569]|uniref:class I SAM-dependent methyltransferase n=1 Tax=Helicobacter sp. MIT 11-5569 TaxID=1548151 RepID=UPI00051FF25D|nr:methyltransferase domain-containing protein [Helicobacter sp. MIT 11-5569]TLD80045.1 methyltransferase domain-containing protein [Helicobacter sp. MIT 11-5569]